MPFFGRKMKKFWMKTERCLLWSMVKSPKRTSAIQKFKPCRVVSKVARNIEIRKPVSTNCPVLFYAQGMTTVLVRQIRITIQIMMFLSRIPNGKWKRRMQLWKRFRLAITKYLVKQTSKTWNEYVEPLTVE